MESENEIQPLSEKEIQIQHFFILTAVNQLSVGSTHAITTRSGKIIKVTLEEYVHNRAICRIDVYDKHKNYEHSWSENPSWHRHLKLELQENKGFVGPYWIQKDPDTSLSTTAKNVTQAVKSLISVN